MITFNCPRCAACHQVKDKLAGTALDCLKCKQGMKVPPVVIASAADSRSNPTAIRQSVNSVTKTAPERAASEPKSDREERRRSRKSLNSLRRRVMPRGLAFWGLIGGGGTALCLIMSGIVFLPKWFSRPSSSPVTQNEVMRPQEPLPPKELTVKEISTQCSPSVAQIRSPAGTGSGFLIGPGLVATNAHVIEGTMVGAIEICFPSSDAGGKTYSATLVYEDRKRDLAVLKVNSSIKPLLLAGSEPDLGEEVVVIGSPGSVGGQVSLNTVTTGVISNKNVKLDGQEHYQLSAPLNPGNSGGPVFNRRGQIIGVVVASLRNKQAMNYAVPLGDVRKAVEKVQRSPAEHARVGAEHDFIEVFRPLGRTTRACNLVLQDYCDEMSASAARNENITVGLQRAMLRHNKRLDAYIERVLTPILPSLTQITSNKAVSEIRRRRLQELWDTYREAKNWIDKPRGTLADFKAKTRDLTEKADRLIQQLGLDLGLDSLSSEAS